MGSPRRIGGGAKSGIRSTTHRLRGSHRSIQGERMRTRMHFRTTAARLDADRGPLWGPTGGYTEEQPGLPPIRQSRPFDLLRSAHRMNSRQPSLIPRDRRDREQAENGQPGRILRLWGHDGHDILSHGNVRPSSAESTGLVIAFLGPVFLVVLIVGLGGDVRVSRTVNSVSVSIHAPARGATFPGGG